MITIKNPEEIKKMAESGRILASVLRRLAKEAKIGVRLSDLNKLAYELTLNEKARPAFLGYRPEGAFKGFGASICASINETVVHGFPSDYCLKDGDVLKLDFGVERAGYFSDAAITVGIGKISKEAKRLMKATKSALEKAIKTAKPGKTLGDIGWAIERTAEKNGLKVIRDLTGHGIGKELHEDPTIYNFGEKGKGIELKPGMVLAIEPMLAVGSERTVQKPDESWATADGSLSAHFEHTVAIAEKGPIVLTK